jgi:hypothetical protein
MNLGKNNRNLLRKRAAAKGIFLLAEGARRRISEILGETLPESFARNFNRPFNLPPQDR